MGLGTTDAEKDKEPEDSSLPRTSWPRAQGVSGKKRKKNNKGLKRKAWLEQRIASLRDEGRWVGQEPSAAAKRQRLQQET